MAIVAGVDLWFGKRTMALRIEVLRIREGGFDRNPIMRETIPCGEYV